VNAPPPSRRLACLLLLLCAGGASATAPVEPVPGHPRPQVAREHWLSLNGPWDFALGPLADTPPDPALPRGEAAAFPRRIKVPFAWQSRASGIATLATSGEAWYRREVMVPAEWHTPGRRVRLHVGRADFETTAWINGQAVGQHAGAYQQFDFDLTDYLHAGPHPQVIVLRVRDVDADDQPSGLQDTFTPMSGVWGDVWLEAAPAARVLSVTPANVQVELPPANLEYELAAEGPGLTGPPAGGWPRVRARQPGRTLVPWQLAWREEALAPWHPDRPGLQALRISLRPLPPDAGWSDEAPPADVVHSYLAPGPRPTLGPVDDALWWQVLIAGEPVFLRGAGYTAWWPDTLGTPPDDEAIVRDFTLARELGLNALRFKQTVPSPRMVYWADRLGLALMVDLPAARTVNLLRKDDHREDWGSNLNAVRPSWYYVPKWDDMFLGFAREARFAPSLWLVRLQPHRLPLADAGRGADLLHWLHWRWHNVASWSGAHAVEWPGNSGRTIQPSWWDLTITTRDPTRARIELAAQLATERFRVFEVEDVARTDQRAETVIVSDFGRNAWWDGDVDMGGPLAALLPVVQEVPHLAGWFWTDLTDTEWERYGLVRFDRTEKRFARDPATSRAWLRAVLRGAAPPAPSAPDANGTGARFTFRPGDAHAWSGTGVVSPARYGQHRFAAEGPGGVDFVFDLAASGLPRQPVAGRLELEAAAFAGTARRDREFADYPWARRTILYHGELDYRVRLQGPLLRHEEQAPAYPQSYDTGWPSLLRASANGVPLGTVTLADDWATAEGRASWQSGLLPGAHGEPVTLAFGADTWAAVLAAAREDHLVLRLEFAAPAAADAGGGLALYGPALGRGGPGPAWVFPALTGSQALAPLDPQHQSARFYPPHWRIVRPADATPAQISTTVAPFVGWSARALRVPAQTLALLDLGAAFPAGVAEGISLTTQVHVPTEQTVLISTGSTDAWRLDLTRADGQVIPYLGNPSTWQGVRPDDKAGFYTLAPGWNTLRLQAWHRNRGPWQVTVRVTDEHGQALPPASFRAGD
jgi:hypothetical protein